MLLGQKTIIIIAHRLRTLRNCNKMIEKIFHKDKEISIIIRSNYSSNGIQFFTPDDCSQQLAYMKRPQGYSIEPHVHNLVNREVNYTQEVLFIKSGKLRVDFYDPNKKYLESKILIKGDVILLISGGHGFEMIEESEIIEVKQGPYSGEEDKTRFNTISEEHIIIK